MTRTLEPFVFGTDHLAPQPIRPDEVEGYEAQGWTVFWLQTHAPDCDDNGWDHPGPCIEEEA